MNRAATSLSAAGIDNARLDAEVLLRHVLGRDRSWLLVHLRDTPDTAVAAQYEETISRRLTREPVQHIIGRQEFRGISCLVTPDVLIPRPETEFVVDAALDAVADRSNPLILDLCTGSGCIAVSLSTELPGARLIATDVSAEALAIARVNAANAGVDDRIAFFQGDLFSSLEQLDILGQVDTIVSNPPYIPVADRPSLQPEVRDYEPALALFGGPLGTELHARIIDGAPKFLKPGGSLIMEIGIGQAEALRGLVQESGAFGGPTTLKDLAGIERVLCMRRL